MKIVIGADHGGFFLKNEIAEHLQKQGFEVCDIGTFSESSCDYSDIAANAARAVANGEYDKGILVCGTGIGMSIAANKIKGIRCALLSDVFSAKATREHNDANMASLGARVVGSGLALELVDAFLGTDFSGDERHVRRIAKITQLEG